MALKISELRNNRWLIVKCEFPPVRVVRVHTTEKRDTMCEAQQPPCHSCSEVQYSIKVHYTI